MVGNDLVSDDINTIAVRMLAILFDIHFHFLAHLLSINIDDIGVVQIYIRDGQNETFAEWLSHKLQVVYLFKNTLPHSVSCPYIIKNHEHSWVPIQTCRIFMNQYIVGEHSHTTPHVLACPWPAWRGLIALPQNSRALSQYMDRLSQVWGFPC